MRRPARPRAGSCATLLLVALLIIAALPSAAAAQAGVRVRDAGPGRPGRLLRAALAEPHVLIVGDSAATVRLAPDTAYARSVIVVGAPATVASRVEGDVIVVGGDLFLHPGAIISGRAIAIGGGVYNSTLAAVQGERLSFRDETFVATAEPGGGVVLDYRRLVDAPRRGVMLAGFRGVGLPEYTRVDGLTVPFGVALEWDRPAVALEAGIAWRSHLGAIDPRLQGGIELGRRTWIEVAAGRGTFTNDDWIRRDILNSLITLVAGRDTRNYYRADRAELAIARRWEGESTEISPWIGALIERAWSIGSPTPATSTPWSITGRDDVVEGMPRPNPPVLRGRTTSAQAGARGLWEAQGLTAQASVRGEVPLETPDDTDWQQLTVDAEVEFPTFRSHRLTVATHVVTTFGGIAPPQRFAYLGGSGTLPTFDLLSFGGDELVFAEGRYTIPIESITLPYVGPPRVVLRYMIGGAGIGDLPDLEQNLGVRLAVALVRVDWTIEPVSGDTEVSFGVSFGR